MKKVLQELSHFPVVQSSKKSNQATTKIRFDLEKKGTIIPAMDIMIAAVALAENAILVTKDHHYEHIPELKLIVLD